MLGSRSDESGRSPVWLMLGMLSAMLACGCQQGNFWSKNPQASNVAPQQQQQLAQLQELQRRTGQLDLNNNDLHAQLAESQRNVSVLQQHVEALNTQLSETTSRLNESQVAKDEVQEEFRMMQASVQRRGGATITANTSLGRQLTAVQVPGLEVRQDGDVVRIELPSDQLFSRGTTTIQTNGASLIEQAADAVARAYPRNIIGIEGNTDDSAAASPWQSQHQLSAAQAMAVMNHVVQSGRLRADHLFVMGHGPNQPVASNGTLVGKSRNRRVEFVVYPETR